MRARNISLVLAFAAVLVAPTVAKLLRWNPMGSLDEKRPLAERPKGPLLSRDIYKQAPVMAQAWEKYFNDHFGLRKLLVGSYRLLTFHGLRMSPNPAVVVGRSDGERRWLFYDASVAQDGIGLASVQGKAPYTPAALARVVAEIRQVAALVRSRGAKLLIIVSPDKQTIYPEYLPRAKRPRPGAVSRLDQFWRVAPALADIPLLDMRIPLRQAKAGPQLFYPSDTHWNPRGTFLAYQATMRALRALDPPRAVPADEQVQWLARPHRVGDLTVLMGVPPIGGDRDWQPVIAPSVLQAVPKRGKLLLVFDSFFASVRVLLENHFDQVTAIPRTRRARAVITGELLDAEKPDVVIIESVERYWTMD